MRPEEPAPVLLDERHAASLLPDRDPRGHKGTFGRVAIVAGSLDYAGAALMAAAAALRAGSGLVVLWLPASLQPHLAGRVPELVTRGWREAAPGETAPEAAAAAVLEEPQDVLLVGPGLRPGHATSRFVRILLEADGPPAVVDAEALGALAGQPGWPERLRRRCVLTPHPGELRRLGFEPGSADTERRAAALAAAARWSQVVVLKGAGTVIADPDGQALRAPFEVPALGTAGSGDVLAGIVASLIGQGLSPFDAAALGVWLHGRAGADLSADLGDAGLMATDLLAAIPRVRARLREGR
jgi:NAD(P)H-hydrate epimerase